MRNITLIYVQNRLNSHVLQEIGIEEHDGDVEILDRKWKYGRFVHMQWKTCNLTLIIY